MNNFSNIQSLKQLYSEKQQLEKVVRRQEKVVLYDINGIQNGAKKWIEGVFRVKNIVKFFLPKLEIATVLFPVIKRIFRKRR